MLSKLSLVFALLFITMGLRVSADTPQVHYLDDHLQLIVQHSQGWGQLGINVAAHDPAGATQPLQIGSVPYKRGLGIHAAGQTILDLGGQYQLFEAEVGVHKQPQVEGSVHLTILADGKRIYKSGLMRNGDQPVKISLKIKGAQILEIVTDDAGDGFMCDAFNLCNARLTVDPKGVRRTQVQQMEIGRFAQLMEWDGHRTEGSPNGRTEEFPADELFLGTPVKANTDGLVKVNPINGLGCIGLEWIERRRISRLELPITAGSSIKPSQVTLQQWAWEPKYMNGGSRWQGAWVSMNGQLSVKDGRVVFSTTSLGAQITVGGVLKVRWLINGLSAAAFVGRPLVYTRTLASPVTVQLRGVGSSPASIQLYNCYLADSPDALSVNWDRKSPLTLKLIMFESHYSPQDSSRLVLKWAGGGCGLSINDMINNKRIWAPEYNLEAGIAPLPKSAPVKHGETTLTRIQSMPEQTFKQALKALAWPEKDTGPTLLSLAAGQHKILAERTGEINFDWSLSILAMVQGGIGRSYSWVIAPKIGVNKAEFVSRTMLDGYLPSPQIDHIEGKVRYHQSGSVLPLGDAPQGSPSWYRDAVMYVQQITATNTGKDAAAASVQMSARVGSEPQNIATEGNISRISLPNGYTAWMWCEGASFTGNAKSNTYTASGMLQPGQSAKMWLVIPSTDMTAQQVQAKLAGGNPEDSLRSYWNLVEKNATQIQLPDAMLQHTIQASRIHCWMAARNESKGNIVAPWIASTNYGPLESESHAVIRGMMVMGEQDFAQRGLQFFEDQVNPRGYLTTGYTVMGTGWHLWCLGEYASLYPVKDWVKQNSETLVRTCKWIIEQRHKTMHTNPDGSKVDEWGLMPPGVMADWEVYSYYFYLNGYYYAGLKQAAQALASIGIPEAAEFNAEANDMSKCIMRAFHNISQQAPVVPLNDGRWVPMYPTHAYCPEPVVDLYPGFDAGRSWCYDIELGAHHLVTFGVMSPSDPAVQPMIEHMEDTYFLKSGWNRYDEAGNRADWFNRGGFAKVQPYYSRHAEIYAMLDNRKAFIRTYFNNIASLLNKEDLSIWEHFFFGAFNKTHETGGFLHQSRMMLVTDFDDTLRLAPFVPSDWMKGDKPIVAKNLPTRFGVVSYEIQPHKNPSRIEASVQIPTGGLKPARVELCIPIGKISSVRVNGQAWSRFDAKTGLIDLTGLTGNVQVSVK